MAVKVACLSVWRLVHRQGDEVALPDQTAKAQRLWEVASAIRPRGLH